MVKPGTAAIFHVLKVPSAVYDQLTRPTHRNGRFFVSGVKICYIWEHLQKK